MTWLNICSKCGYQVKRGAVVDSKCPGCGASSWLCHLLESPATPAPVVADGFVTPDDATKSKSSCNKIVARKNHKVGRPPAGIDLSRVAALRAEGYSLRGIADKLGVSHMTVKRVLAEHGLKLGDFIKGRV